MNAEMLMKEFSTVKSVRAPFEPVWDLCAKYAMQRKYGFTAVQNPGAFYQAEEVFDNTANRALKIMCSSLMGALWKNGPRTFRLVKPRQIRETRVIKSFYEEANARLHWQMDHERSGLAIALDEYLHENGAFGTAAIGVFEARGGGANKLEYRALGLKNLYVVEDATGRVYKVFYEVELDAFQILAEYGEVARSSERVRAALDGENREQKFKVLWVLQPREQLGNGIRDGMAYESIHILEDDKNILRQSGYRGLPVIVQRFYKNEGEAYGRSPTSEAINDIIELNALIEMLTQSSEVAYKPPVYMLDDGSFGNGIIDRSPGAVNVLDMSSGRITGASPLGQISNVGDMNPAFKIAEKLYDQILAHYYVDKLTDLNNKTRMTLGEAQLRNELRADSLGGVFSRQMAEMFTPLIRRSIAVLEAAGVLGVEAMSPEARMAMVSGQTPLVIPPELADLRRQGFDIYEIEYVSPASRILKAEELRGILSTWQFAAAFGQVAPELLIRLDKKRSLEMVRERQGAPSELLLSEDEFAKEMEAYTQAQNIAAQMRQQAAVSEIGEKQAAAQQMAAQAEATRGDNFMTGVL